MNYADRNRAIVAAFVAGRSYAKLGADHDLTRRRIRQIVKGAGVCLADEELHRRFKAGRPRLPIEGAARAEYMWLIRKGIAWPDARRMMGIAA